MVLGVFRSLMPREGSYFELFHRHALCVVAGAEALDAMLAGGGAVERHCREVLAQEEAADAVTAEVVLAVRRTFVTPFDRGDIQALISRMDDTIDSMKKVAKAVRTFGTTEFDPGMQVMGRSILTCSGTMRDLMPLLANVGRNAPRIHEMCAAMRRVETEADEVHEAGVRAMHAAARADPATVLAYLEAREVFDLLEKAVDSFDDVANEIDAIVVEHV
jgi:uncharacterized protein Yka (UPF0111/DUF47 family)